MSDEWVQWNLEKALEFARDAIKGALLLNGRAAPGGSLHTALRLPTPFG